MNHHKKNIIWLVSYPKSGNTWIRLFFENLVANKSDPVLINQLQYSPSAGNLRILEDHIGIYISDLTNEEIQNLRPEVYNSISSHSEEVAFLKVHDAMTKCPNGLELFPIDITKAVIYIIRNPLDIAVSYSFHNSCSIPSTIEKMLDERRFICSSINRIQTQCRQFLSSWSNHVDSWTTNQKLPTMVVRYEDLKNNPLKNFRRIVEFTQIQAEESKIKKAIKFSEFSFLKKQEERYGFKERPLNAIRFFREGQINSWRKHLNEELKCSLVNKNSIQMKKYNYL